LKSISLYLGDEISGQMAGPGVRALEIGRLLSKTLNVSFITPKGNFDLIDDTIINTSKSYNTLKEHKNNNITIQMIQSIGINHLKLPVDFGPRPVVIVDLYCPSWLENGVAAIARSDATQFQHRRDITILRDQLRHGDYFLCASMRQRDLLVGMLSVVGRVTSAQIKDDPSLSRLIGIVPFGMSSNDFVQVGPTVNSLLPSLTSKDRVVVWGGGIHDWLDVETPIHAMALLRDRAPHIKLLFATSVSHPDHEVRPNAAKAQLLAINSGLLQKSVFFLEGWTPYDERDRYLRGATIGLVCHQDHVETRFAFRTRVLDYLWAGLPIVTSDGDEFADLIRKFDLGIVVPPGDPQALADAFVTLVERIDAGEPFNDRIASIRPLYHWDEVVKPLLEFCANPRKTAQLGDPVLMAGLPDVMTPRREVSRLLYRTMTVLRSEGPKTVVRKVARKMLTLLRRARSG